MAEYGQLKISLVEAGSEVPIPGAAVEVSSTGEPDRILERLVTDSSGQTETVELEAPPVEYSMQPSEEQHPAIPFPHFEIASLMRNTICGSPRRDLNL